MWIQEDLAEPPAREENEEKFAGRRWLSEEEIGRKTWESPQGTPGRNLE